MDVTIQPQIAQMHTDKLTVTAIEMGLLMDFANEPTSKWLVYDKHQKAICLICVDLWLNGYKWIF